MGTENSIKVSSLFCLLCSLCAQIICILNYAFAHGMLINLVPRCNIGNVCLGTKFSDLIAELDSFLFLLGFILLVKVASNCCDLSYVASNESNCTFSVFLNCPIDWD